MDSDDDDFDESDATEGILSFFSNKNKIFLNFKV